MGVSRFLLRLVAAFLCSLCVCASGFSHHAVPASRSDLPGNIVDEMFLWRRSTAEAVAPAVDPALPNSSFILAAERTHRKDPLDNFKHYNGGWNISNERYWAEEAYKSWTGTLDYAVHQANITAENLLNFSSILSVAKRSGVDQFFMSASDQARIDKIQTWIKTSADDLTRRVDDISDKIHDLLDNV